MSDMDLYDDLYVLSGTPNLPLPAPEELREVTLEELEEEYAGLMRKHQDLLDAGRHEDAADLKIHIAELEDIIADLETADVE